MKAEARPQSLRIVIRLMLASLVAWGIWAVYDAWPTQPTNMEERKAVHGFNDDPVFFNVRIGGQRFRIPRGYVHSVATHNGPVVRGVADEVYLFHSWPELMTGARTAKDYTPDRLVVIALTAVTPETYREGKLNALDYYRKTKWRNVIPLPDIGLREYQRERYDGGWGTLSYVPLDSQYQTADGHEYWLYCTTFGRKPPQGTQCRINYTIKPTVGIDYSFYWEHLKDWKGIDQSIRKMLSSYMGER